MASTEATDAAGPLKKYKQLANMSFNQHGGRRGTRSASSMADKMLRNQADKTSSIRPGPKGMGMRNPHKPTKLAGEQHLANKKFSHLHQMHEKYNEK
jgi:hypothetical protein